MSHYGFDWDRCDHEGIGKPGCETCDPIDQHRTLRLKYLLAKTQERAGELEADARALAANADRLADALSALRGRAG